mmetsp:Transcript_10120/g.23641  ORF Transcript_10120/g.23641 Transcript_10120/m.23641 type:complete len:242 (-) Transcript_10120:112-837(-)
MSNNWWDVFACTDAREPCCPGGVFDDADPRAKLPHARELAISPNTNSRLWTELVENYGPCGVGITFKYVPAIQFFQVQALVPEGPALRSGQVYVGDLLVAVDDQSAKGLPLQELARFMIGPAGSIVKLTLHRQVSGSIEEPSTPTSNPSPPKLQELTVTLSRQVVDNSPRVNMNRPGSQASSLTSSPLAQAPTAPSPRLGGNLKAGPSFVNSGGVNGSPVHVQGFPVMRASSPPVPSTALV